MKTVQFSEVPTGEWFKPTKTGTWHLKTSHTKGMYQHFGTKYEPTFAATDIVYVN